MRSTSTTVFAVAEPSEVQESGKAEKGNEMLFRTFTLWCFGRFSNHSKVIEIDNG